jgi:hypothetical protein
MSGAALVLFRASVLDGIDAPMELPVFTSSDDADLPRLGILRNVWVGVRRDDQHAGDPVALVPDLMTALRPARQRDDISFAKLPVPVVQANSRLSAEHNEQFIAAVMEVVDELTATGLELPQRRAQRPFAPPHQSPRADTAPVGDLLPHVARILKHVRTRESSGHAPGEPLASGDIPAHWPKRRFPSLSRSALPLDTRPWPELGSFEAYLT